MDIEIKDRVAEGDNKYIMTTLSDGRVQLDPSPDSVTEPGTPLNKSLLQPLVSDTLTFKETLTEVDDLNNVTETGIYVYATASRPANAPFENAAVVEVFGSKSKTSQKIQRAYRYGQRGYSAYRQMLSGKWGRWTYGTVLYDLELIGLSQIKFKGEQTASTLFNDLTEGNPVIIVATTPEGSKYIFTPSAMFFNTFLLKCDLSPVSSYYFTLTPEETSSVQTLNVVDVIVETGIANGWNFRKWASGRMEAWGNLNATVTEEGTNAGVSGIVVITAQVKFPQGMLTGESNIEYCSLQARDYRIFGNMSGISANNLWGRFTTSSSAAADFPVNSTNFMVHAHIIGSWQ